MRFLWGSSTQLLKSISYREVVINPSLVDATNSHNASNAHHHKSRAARRSLTRFPEQVKSSTSNSRSSPSIAGKAFFSDLPRRRLGSRVPEISNRAKLGVLRGGDDIFIEACFVGRLWALLDLGVERRCRRAHLCGVMNRNEARIRTNNPFFFLKKWQGREHRRDWGRVASLRGWPHPGVSPPLKASSIMSSRLGKKSSDSASSNCMHCFYIWNNISILPSWGIKLRFLVIAFVTRQWSSVSCLLTLICIS